MKFVRQLDYPEWIYVTKTEMDRKQESTEKRQPLHLPPADFALRSWLLIVFW